MHKNKDAWWLCKCDCGGTVAVAACNLKTGAVRSCGCLLLEVITKPPGEASFNVLYSCYRNGAKQRGHKFSLTKDQFREITGKDCYFCGIEPKQAHALSAHHNGDYLHNGIDRIDPDEGYTLANCVPCCKSCNFAKGRLTVEEFLAWLHRICSFQLAQGNLKLNKLATGEYVLGEDMD